MVEIHQKAQTLTVLAVVELEEEVPMKGVTFQI